MTDTALQSNAMTEERKRALMMGAAFAVFTVLMLGVIIILGMDIVGK